MPVLVWLLRAALFFVLFAFALNNRQAVTVNWFFGVEWSAPLIIIVLLTFAGGCVIGVLAMLPSWWSRMRSRAGTTPAAAPAAARHGPHSTFDGEHPPREGL